MCARYTMATPPDELIEEFEATLVADQVEPHYNIAPTQKAPIVVLDRSGQRRLGLARFGLVPHWADDLRIGARLLNARAETVARKPAFRDAFSRHRCLVLADGFYEWRREDGAKIPYRFRLPKDRPFGMAGLWAVWRDEEGNKVSSFAIVTRQAEGQVAEVHDRMPVVLDPSAYAAWLDRDLRRPEDVEPLLREHRAAQLAGYRVSTRVNSVKNDEPSLIEPAAS